MEAPKAGTRLSCPQCGTEAIVVKAPGGPLSCCGSALAGPTQQGAAPQTTTQQMGEAR